MPPTVYPLHRPYALTAFAGALVFVVGGVGLLVSHGSAFRFAGGALVVAFFGAAALVIGRRLASPEPELTIADEGFKGWATAPVAWSEVRHVTARANVAGPRGRSVVEVVLHDPAAYLARTTGPARLAAKGNLRRGFSPVSLPAIRGRASLRDIMLTMKSHRPDLLIID